MPRPTRVEEHATRQSHHIGTAFGENRLGLLRFGNQTHRDRRQTRFTAEFFSQGNLVIFPNRNFLVR